MNRHRLALDSGGTEKQFVKIVSFGRFSLFHNFICFITLSFSPYNYFLRIGIACQRWSFLKVSASVLELSYLIKNIGFYHNGVTSWVSHRMVTGSCKIPLHIFVPGERLFVQVEMSFYGVLAPSSNVLWVCL